MALATRIIPMLLHAHGNLVKGVRFQSWRTVGHALQAAKIHQARNVDELLFLDVAATPESSKPDLALVQQLTQGCFMPITAGGGVTSVDNVKALLRAGADKVAICTAIHTRSGVIKECANVVGSQAIVAVIETDQGRCHAAGREWYDISPEDLARHLEHQGAGEIMLMSRDRDGTLEGYDLQTLEAVAGAVDVPIVAAGGAGTYEHMLQATKAGASAVAAGAMFQWTDQTPRGAARYLAERGVETRI
jgi:cyclase